MADPLPERDAALLLDMLLAARDAKSFVAGLSEAAFVASRLHQNTVIRSLEIISEAAGKVSAETCDAHPETMIMVTVYATRFTPTIHDPIAFRSAPA
jgi:uncharacterized protein with HEPN domain